MLMSGVHRNDSHAGAACRTRHDGGVRTRRKRDQDRRLERMRRREPRGLQLQGIRCRAPVVIGGDDALVGRAHQRERRIREGIRDAECRQRRARRDDRHRLARGATDHKAADHHVIAGENLHARGDVREARRIRIDGLLRLRAIRIDLKQRGIDRLEVRAGHAA
jgi:hypothetical protein